jgi:hypothetical protein
MLSLLLFVMDLLSLQLVHPNLVGDLYPFQHLVPACSYFKVAALIEPPLHS